MSNTSRISLLRLYIHSLPSSLPEAPPDAPINRLTQLSLDPAWVSCLGEEAAVNRELETVFFSFGARGDDGTFKISAISDGFKALADVFTLYLDKYPNSQSLNNWLEVATESTRACILYHGQPLPTLITAPTSISLPPTEPANKANGKSADTNNDIQSLANPQTKFPLSASVHTSIVATASSASASTSKHVSVSHSEPQEAPDPANSVKQHNAKAKNPPRRKAKVADQPDAQPATTKTRKKTAPRFATAEARALLSSANTLAFKLESTQLINARAAAETEQKREKRLKKELDVQVKLLHSNESRVKAETEAHEQALEAEEAQWADLTMKRDLARLKAKDLQKPRTTGFAAFGSTSNFRGFGA
ncbi:hypothetical protein C8R43DRAFT_493057 [Mycena crocata]|nr:hypothetical protein C8R43DRAFT_493057 [Mycena crocata]